MKETKVYVDELPEYCDDCPCSLRDKDDCAYCNLLHKNIGYDFGKRPKHCPLQSLKTHNRELVKEVCDEIKNKLGSIEDILINLGNGKEDALSYFMYILNKTQKEYDK